MFLVRFSLHTVVKRSKGYHSKQNDGAFILQAYCFAPQGKVAILLQFVLIPGNSRSFS